MTGALDIAGNIGGEVGDFFGEPLKAVASAALTPQAKQTLLGTVQKIARTPEAQAVLQAWSKLQAQHPDAAKNIGNAVNIAALFGGEAASPTVEDAASVVKQGSSAVKDAATSAGAIASDAAKGAADLGKNALKSSLTAAQDIATPIDKNVLSVLQAPTPETENTLKQMFSQAKTAVSETGAPTPFDTVGKTNLGGALDSLNSQLTAAGKAKEAALARVGSTPVDIAPVSKDFYSQLEQKLGTIVNGSGKLESATGRESLVANSPGDAKLITQVHDLLTRLNDNSYGKATTAQRVNDAVDGIQKALYDSKQIGAQPIASQTEGVMRQIVGSLNDTVKKATQEGIDAAGKPINPYADANATYSRLLPSKTI